MNKVLINGQWRSANACGEFNAFNPTNGEPLVESYPVSSWQDCEDALDAAADAFAQMQQLPEEILALFLETYAELIEVNRDALVDMANLETGLAKSPRLSDVELPRTTNQLRLAAKAVREFSWQMPIIDSQNNIRSMLQAIGPVVVFGPNNFPFAFGSISGGDFAAAIAAGNPVIAKAHPLHPGTTRLFAELARQAGERAGLPSGSIQMIYAVENDSGLKLVSDPRIAATAFTGSRAAGLKLKEAADCAGKLIFLEMSSLNPVVLFKGALQEKGDKIAEEFTNSCVVAAGQLCTKPGILIIPAGEEGDRFCEQLSQGFNQAQSGTLLSATAADQLNQIASELVAAGAQLLTACRQEDSNRFCHPNTLLMISADQFINEPHTFEREMFGNATLLIRTNSTEQTADLIQLLDGNLTGCLYSHSEGMDDDDYRQIEPILRRKVGRLLNDKMPTGVAVSPAMNHGGPYPSTGHPGFTSVGFPAAIKRFAALKCFDNVRHNRLPKILQDKSPGDTVWRYIDGIYTTKDVVQ